METLETLISCIKEKKQSYENFISEKILKDVDLSIDTMSENPEDIDIAGYMSALVAIKKDINERLNKDCEEICSMIEKIKM